MIGVEVMLPARWWADSPALRTHSAADNDSALNSAYITRCEAAAMPFCRPHLYPPHFTHPSSSLDSMTMDASLQSVEADFLDYKRPIFDVLKATLQYPIRPDAKATRLADGMVFIITYRTEGVAFCAITWRVWSLLLEIVGCVPPDHPWQDSLVQGLDSLRQREAGLQEGSQVSFADAP